MDRPLVDPEIDDRRGASPPIMHYDLGCARMQFIPPKNRFSTHQRSLSLSPDIVTGAVSRFGLRPERTELRRLTGGFMNANYLAVNDGDRFVIRVYSTDNAVADRECDLLTFLATRNVLVPAVLGRFDVEGYPVAILEFIDGISLEDRLLSEVETPPELYRDIGAQLAAMHRITFSEAGFLGPRLTFGHEYVTLSPFLREFVERTLTMLLKRPERLNPDLNERLSRLVQDKWAMVNDTEPRRQLVHCDFNPKNLLVSRGAAPTLLAVLDWEFCLSGNGLGDLGNFFRFEYDYPDTARDAFIGGYRSVEPDLPANWFEVARLMDLASMCSFLARPEDYRESFHTARVVIEATLTHFGY